MTDPSYGGQLITFTFPMVGNYGVADERRESRRIHVRGVLMREARGPEWTSWLTANGVVARPIPLPKETSMKWETPKALDLRFGFEITMYVATR